MKTHNFFFAIFLFIAACEDSSIDNESPTLFFSLSASSENILANSSMALTKDCSKTLCFYEFSTSSKNSNKGVAVIDPDNKPLHLKNIISTALITYGSSYVSSSKIRVAAAPSNSEHTESIRYFKDSLIQLKNSGWRRYILPNEARIPGTEAKKFDHFDELLGVPVGTGPWKDPELVIDKAHWLDMPTINSWYFYKGGNYLVFRVQRENHPQLPEERGSYLFSYNFETEAEFYKNFVENEHQDDWILLLPAELKRMAQERAHTEARLKKMGIAIDEDYQDPPIKALQ